MATIDELYIAKEKVEEILKENLAFKYMAKQIYKDTTTLHSEALEHESRMNNHEERKKRPVWESDL